MEQFLPLVLALLALGFRVYTNFQKEQEKARSRNISKPPTPEPHFPDSWLPQSEAPKYEQYPEVEPQEVFIPEKPYEPVYQPLKAEKPTHELVSEPRYERMRPEHIITTDGRSPETVTEEVRRGRAIHAVHHHKFTPHEEIEERSAYADLDMEDAVIKSAILNRPEWIRE
ncbi:MAG TPA: hypothetical protein VGD90_12815 [Sphingobacteriaceae bacterium]